MGCVCTVVVCCNNNKVGISYRWFKRQTPHRSVMAVVANTYVHTYVRRCITYQTSVTSVIVGICMYIHTYEYIHMYVCTYVCMYVYVHTYICTYMDDQTTSRKDVQCDHITRRVPLRAFQCPRVHIVCILC